MIKHKSKNGVVKIFTDDIEDLAFSQIKKMSDSPLAEGAQVRIMPDVHAGKGSTIGTTIKLPEDRSEWKISPNIVGVDIGCGMTSVRLKSFDMDLEAFDKIVHEVVPTGFSVHQEPNGGVTRGVARIAKSMGLQDKAIERIDKSLGTLGGGNHFIELGIDSKGAHWLTVHSGSRSLGTSVARHYQDVAERSQTGKDFGGMIDRLKAEGRHQEIEAELQKFKQEHKPSDKDLAYLTGVELEEYIDAMEIAQLYAIRNRAAMLKAILGGAGLSEEGLINSTHNFIDIENGVIRKGATSATKDELLLIPINMRDGMIIARGLGNEDWNESAPHGAGRLMSRTAAKEKFRLTDFQETMEGIYSSSVVASTIDESPFAYKSIEDITKHIDDTVKVLDIVKPIYNFKAK